MDKTLPRRMHAALSRAKKGDLGDLLEAKDHLEAQRSGSGWLALWHVASSESNPVFRRALSFALAKQLTEGGRTTHVDALLLWAMQEQSDDLSTLTNLLSALESSLCGGSGIPEIVRSTALPFLLRCLEHPEPLVRHNALDLLASADQAGALGEIVHRAAASHLAQCLVQACEATIEDDEREVLMTLTGALQGGELPELAPTGSRALRRLVLDLEDAAATDEPQGTTALLEMARHRALLDSAADESRRARAPIQTVRVPGEDPPTRLIDAIWRFAETVAGLQPQNDNDDDTAQVGVGIRARAALAASFPVHLIYEGDAADAVFFAVSQIYEMLHHPESADAIVPALAPPVAEAAWRLVEHASGLGGPIEIVLTDPRRKDWQRILVGDFSAFTPAARNLLLERARQVQPADVVLEGADVPQANTIAQVFEAVDAMLKTGDVKISDISNITTRRQVDYYRQGARILGLFDDDNFPTARARALAGLSSTQRLQLAAIYFEDSPVGRAWRDWMGVRRLSDVDASTAERFLRQCARGLSGTTLPRRASTLRKWYAELMPYHYANRGK